MLTVNELEKFLSTITNKNQVVCLCADDIEYLPFIDIKEDKSQDGSVVILKIQEQLTYAND